MTSRVVPAAAAFGFLYANVGANHDFGKWLTGVLVMPIIYKMLGF